MRKTKRFNDALRLQIIEEHLSGSSIYSLVRKYQLGSSNNIYNWMRTFGIKGGEEKTAPDTFMSKRKADAGKSEEVLALELEIKKLKKALAYEKMRADAYDTMIDLAEQTYQIKVRKNSATKQP